MRSPIIFTIIACLGATGRVALANDISCDGQHIRDDQDVPAMKSDVLEKCGKPESVDEQIWIYNMHNGNKKILQFNDSEELESISDTSSD